MLLAQLTKVLLCLNSLDFDIHDQARRMDSPELVKLSHVELVQKTHNSSSRSRPLVSTLSKVIRWADSSLDAN